MTVMDGDAGHKPADPETWALSHLLGVARGFRFQDHQWFDMQVQADMMAEAVEVYDRINGTEDPIEREAALVPIVLDEILERADEPPDDSRQMRCPRCGERFGILEGNDAPRCFFDGTPLEDV